MDPNAALTALRELLADHYHHGTTDLGLLVERFESLDEWLSNGGFLPEAWQRR